MKKSIISSMFAAAAMIVVASCGNKTAPADTTQDSTATDTVSTVTAPTADDNAAKASENAANVLTAKGIGEICLGMSLSSVPSKIDGIYVKKEFISNDDFEGYYLNDKAGENVIMLEGEGKVQRITVLNKAIKTAHGIYVGMPIKELKSVKGLKAVPVDPESDYQIEQYTVDGVTIDVDTWAGKGKLVSQMSVSSY